MSESTEPAFAGWCIVEQMGHRRFAGLASEVTIAGSPMLRLDIPAVEDGAAVTLFMGGSSIFCLTPCSEDVARHVARGNAPAPVSPWDFPKRLAAAGSSVGSAHDDGDDDHEHRDLYDSDEESP